jgi:molecular chaperone GrpE (heat shock protein)
MKAFRIEYTKQVRENEATVVRYRQLIADEKQFAITKFAKDLLDVRDAIRMALENTDLEAAKNEEDLAVLKETFVANVEGQTLTAEVMDNVLRRF